MIDRSHDDLIFLFKHAALATLIPYMLVTSTARHVIQVVKKVAEGWEKIKSA